MTTGVYFDLDGTLCTYAVPYETQFETTVSPYGEATDAAYDAYLERLFEALETCESDPYRRAFEAVVETTGLDASPDTLAQNHCEAELEATRVSADAKRVVERVAETNPVGVLTNGAGHQQRAKLERHGLEDLFDSVIVSGTVGVRKPDRRIFDRAKQALTADEYIYVGDSYEEEIVGAREAGFRPVYVAGGTDEDADAANAVVSSLGELLEPEPLPASVGEPFEPPKN